MVKTGKELINNIMISLLTDNNSPPLCLSASLSPLSPSIVAIACHAQYKHIPFQSSASDTIRFSNFYIFANKKINHT